MIINTGARTDTVQYYTDWLLNRFHEGYVLTRNPLFPNKVNRYQLTPDKVDCVVFCSKNYKPILPRLQEITDKFHTYFHYTITAYKKDTEPGAPSIDESMETLIKLSKQVGKKRIAWRYDPILLTEKYTVEMHLQTFSYMANILAPYIDRCIFSFVEMYKKLKTTMPELIPLTKEDKRILAKGLGTIAKKQNISIQTCGTNGSFTSYGIHSSGCITLDILGQANGITFKNLKHKGMRQGCHCIESRDIGAYDTCMNSCKYCYANKNPHKAFENNKLHNPLSPLLIGQLNVTDTVTQKTIDVLLDGKGIRLDVYVQDDQGTVYNVEMQRGRKKELPRRSRFYQSNIDSDQISAGESYKDLKKTFIIFICTFDPFSVRQHIYTFENRCRENPSLTLGDGTTKIFLNTKGVMDDVDMEMLEFLSYVENTTDAFAAQSSSLLIKEIHKRVTEIKQKKLEVEYMTLLQRDRENIKLRREEGNKQMASLIKILLSENRLDDLNHVLEDTNYRNKLFEEYGIL